MKETSDSKTTPASDHLLDTVLRYMTGGLAIRTCAGLASAPPTMGNVQHNTSWTLKGLAPGACY